MYNYRSVGDAIAGDVVNDSSASSLASNVRGTTYGLIRNVKNKSNDIINPLV